MERSFSFGRMEIQVLETGRDRLDVKRDKLDMDKQRIQI